MFARLISLLFILSASNSMSVVHHGSMPVGFHEFVIFGNERIFISHFPMFSSIHAFQIIAEVSLDSESEKTLKTEREKSPKGFFRVQPFRQVAEGAKPNAEVANQDDWILPDTIDVGQSFTANITLKGKPVVLNAKVEVKNIVHKHELNPNVESVFRKNSYVVFGSKNEPFLARVLIAPPKPGLEITDKDQIFGLTYLTGHFPVKPSVFTTKTSNLLALGDKPELFGKTKATLFVQVSSEVHSEDIRTQR